MTATGLILTKDIFFASKVTSTANALGLLVRSASSLESWREIVANGKLALVILDLDCPGISPAEVMASLPTDAGVFTVAFGPHVHEAQLAAATAAGFQHVLPRSRFSAGLVEILHSALAQN